MLELLELNASNGNLLEKWGVSIKVKGDNCTLKCIMMELKDVTFSENQFTEYEDFFYDDDKFALSKNQNILQKRVKGDSTKIKLKEKITRSPNKLHFYSEETKSPEYLDDFKNFLHYKFRRTYCVDNENIYKDTIVDPVEYECITIKIKFSGNDDPSSVFLTLANLVYFDCRDPFTSMSDLQSVITYNPKVKTLSGWRIEGNLPKYLPMCSKFIQILRTSDKYKIYDKGFDELLAIKERIKYINNTEIGKEHEYLTQSSELTDKYFWYMIFQVHYYQTSWAIVREFFEGVFEESRMKVYNKESARNYQKYIFDRSDGSHIALTHNDDF